MAFRALNNAALEHDETHRTQQWVHELLLQMEAVSVLGQRIFQMEIISTKILTGVSDILAIFDYSKINGENKQQSSTTIPLRF